MRKLIMMALAGYVFRKLQGKMARQPVAAQVPRRY
jgi:hypothetical protein